MMTAQRSSAPGQSEAFLTSMVENMPAVVFAKDSATCRFILLNRASEEFLGIPCAAIIGKTDHDFFPKEKADASSPATAAHSSRAFPKRSRKSRKPGYA